MRKLFLALLLVLCACSSKDPVQATIEKAVDAAEDRDSGDVMKYVSASYPNRAEVEQSLRRYFFAYRKIDIRIEKLETSHSTNTGAATFILNFLGVPKQIGGLDQLLPSSASYRFDVQLAREGDEWKVTSAEWEQVSGR